MLVELFVVSILICFSGLLSCGETSLTAANRARIHRNVTEGKKNAKRAMDVIERKDKIIPVLLLGNNALNVLAASLATAVFVDLMGNSGIAVATVIMTLILFLLGELIPKIFALHKADSAILRLSIGMQALDKVLYPLVRLMEEAIVHKVLGIFGIDSKVPSGAGKQEDLRSSIELHEKDGFLVRENRDMLTSICDLEKVQVEDVMLHRKSMHTICIDWTREQILEYIRLHNHIYFPVWQEESDNIVGVLDIKSLVGASDDSDIRSIMHEPRFAPASRTLSAQLKLFKNEDSIALVVDEYGSIIGMITLQDIIEEIVGRLPFSKEREKIIRNSKNSWLVDGDATLRDVRRITDIKITNTRANTVAGFIIDKLGSIPMAGQSFVFGALKCEVVERKKNQLTKILLSVGELLV